MKHETGVVLWAKQSFVELDCVSTDQKVIYKKEKRKEEEKKKKLLHVVGRHWVVTKRPDMTFLSLLNLVSSRYYCSSSVAVQTTSEI